MNSGDNRMIVEESFMHMFSNLAGTYIYDVNTRVD